MIDRVFGIKVRLSGLCINRYWPIIGRLLDADYLPADNWPLPYRCTSIGFTVCILEYLYTSSYYFGHLLVKDWPSLMYLCLRWCWLQTVHSYYRQHSTPAVSAPPPQRQHHYTQSLRQRSLNFQLLDRTSALRDRNFMMRILYCDAFYWQFYFLALILCVTVFSCYFIKT